MMEQQHDWPSAHDGGGNLVAIKAAITAWQTLEWHRYHLIKTLLHIMIRAVIGQCWLYA
jgi:hypothetical protein